MTFIRAAPMMGWAAAVPGWAEVFLGALMWRSEVTILGPVMAPPVMMVNELADGAEERPSRTGEAALRAGSQADRDFQRLSTALQSDSNIPFCGQRAQLSLHILRPVHGHPIKRRYLVT